MITSRTGRIAIAVSALCSLAVVVNLATLRPGLAADEPARAEAERRELATQLRKAQERLAALEEENRQLRADLKDEQLKNAIDVDQEVKRLRDLLRFLPEVGGPKAATPVSAKAEESKPAPPPAPPPPLGGPTGEQLKRLQEELQRRQNEPKAETEHSRPEAETPMPVAGPVAPNATTTDAARLEAEVRAARCECGAPRCSRWPIRTCVRK